MTFCGNHLRAKAHLWAAAATVLVCNPEARAVQPAHEIMSGQPLCFEAVGAANRFQASGLNYALRIGPAEAQVVLGERAFGQQNGLSGRASVAAEAPRSVGAFSMLLVGANPEAAIVGTGMKGARVQRLANSAPTPERAGNPLYSSVRVRNAYKGVDVVYYGNQQRLEYDFVVNPGADASQIQLRFAGADRVALEKDGSLGIWIGDRCVRQAPPRVYQQDGENVRSVRAGYKLGQDGVVHFEVADYNRGQVLVIDPVLSYSTYFGGNSGDLGLSIKLDAAGFIYIAGQTLSATFPYPLPGGVQEDFRGGKINGDAFIAKFDPTGRNLVYFTYLGGTGNDGALDLAVDAAGHAYVAGFTDSADFPTTDGAYDRTINGVRNNRRIYNSDAFVAKLDPSGMALEYSTYFGGTRADAADAIAIDGEGNAYITGYTFSGTGFPLQQAASSRLRGASDLFVAKLSPNGSELVYSTYYGGNGTDEGQGIAVDGEGSAYITGYTSSTDFPTTNAFRTVLNGWAKLPKLYDAFVAKVAADGRQMLYSTLLGGTNSDAGFRIALDGQRNVYVSGATFSVDFPNTVTNNSALKVGFTTQRRANYDAFLTSLTPAGEFRWSSRFGGIRDDVGWDVATDAVGRVFVAGTTSSTNFPMFNQEGFEVVKKANRRQTNYAFVTAFTVDAGLVYSVLLGGTQNDMGYGVAAGLTGDAYVLGKTTSTNYPVTGAFDGLLSGGNDVFISRLSLEPGPTATARKDRNEALPEASPGSDATRPEED